MGEVLPGFEDGDRITFTTSAPVTGGQVLVLTGDREVAPSAGDGATERVGVAAFDAAEGEKVLVYCGLPCWVVCSGAVAFGDSVQTAAAGKVKAYAGTDPKVRMGFCLAGAADGGKALIRLAI